jgi:ferredoxin
MNLNNNIIIGSGPTGVMAANDILKFEKQVLMLDVGNVIEKENYAIKNNFLKDKNRKLFLEQIRKKKKIYQNYKNKNLKFPYGSDYVFRSNKFDIINSSKNVDFIISNAKGGLSNIWGTMVLPFHVNDIKDWDVSYNDFYSEIKNVEKVIPILSSKDNLDNFFSISFGKNHNFNLSKNAYKFYTYLKKRSKELNSKGIFFGRSKLAIGNNYSHEKLNCQECGLCHQGCPYDCMYSSDYLLNKISDNKLFDYHKNIYVEKLEQLNDINIIHAINTNTNKKIIYKTKNLFICAGPISTAAIILRSKLLKGNIVKFKESQRFYIPIIKKKNFESSINQNKNTLSELFLEISNRYLCEKSIHIQYYTFIEEVLKPLERFFGDSVYYLPKIFPFIFNRVNILIGYLNSNYSSVISMTKVSDNNFLLTAKENAISKNIIKNTISFLKNNLKEEFYFLSYLTNINLPGASYHWGSSFPMSSNSEKNEMSTDVNGRLSGYDNIYILDASILPDIPAGPTTFNVCVNVSRIIKNLFLKGKI